MAPGDHATVSRLIAQAVNMSREGHDDETVLAVARSPTLGEILELQQTVTSSSFPRGTKVRPIQPRGDTAPRP